jgi:hypothetical protein
MTFKILYYRELRELKIITKTKEEIVDAIKKDIYIKGNTKQYSLPNIL